MAKAATQAKFVKADLRALTDELGYQMPALDARRSGAELYGAPRFSVFTLFHPNENTLSRVVADLFDPRGMHGQGTLFLNSLLEAINLPRVGIRDVVKVRREVLTEARRRLDLIVETNSLLVGIENKPWAVQQPEQLRDYLEELRKWSGRKRPVLVFISDKEPRTAKGEVEGLPYCSEEGDPSLATVLQRALPKVKAERTKVHIEDFIRYIDMEFGEGVVEQEVDVPYIQAVEAEFDGAPGRRKALAATLLASGTLHRRIVDEIGEFILSEAKREHRDFVLQGETSLSRALEDGSAWTIRRPSWPINCAVGLGSDGDFDGVWSGVKAPDPKSDKVKEEPGTACPERGKVESALRVVGGGRRTVWWPWWQSTEPSEWDAKFAARLVIESPTGAIEHHPDMQALSRHILGFAEALDDHFPK